MKRFAKAGNVPGCPSCGKAPYAYDTEFGFTIRCADIDHDFTVFADTAEEAYAIWERRATKACNIVYGGITEWNGGEYVSANWHCSECGGTMPASSVYCLHCGSKVDNKVKAWGCPNEECSGLYGENPTILERDGGWYQCPKCGCGTLFPEADACIPIYEESESE